MPQTMFDADARATLVRRLSELAPSSPRHWGKMTVDQMLAHCSVALEVPCGDQVKKQRLLGRLLSPLARTVIRSDKPFARNAPTDPDYRIVDQRDFEKERQRLLALIDRFCNLGPAGVDGVVHSFFGRLNGEDWGRLMYKHLDHHLRQFGA